MNPRREYHKAYYQRNKVIILEKMAARYQANKSKYKTRDNRWRQANREAINLSRRLGIFIAKARLILQAQGEQHASNAQADQARVG